MKEHLILHDFYICWAITLSTIFACQQTYSLEVCSNCISCIQISHDIYKCKQVFRICNSNNLFFCLKNPNGCNSFKRSSYVNQCGFIWMPYTHIMLHLNTSMSGYSNIKCTVKRWSKVIFHIKIYKVLFLISSIKYFNCLILNVYQDAIFSE